ncbi:MAG: murein biosynthesis integral membrane protein MurJ [Candidatus Moranbacteria bacterium RIFCSPHIGHO2_01_FULL_55_24]|nr:MAG: murein biosynthesis integral membrane protein MurJ [Candidatus Moranbacteria bacterium RIFCSPHIGHO2_01_FULL_55_24]
MVAKIVTKLSQWNNAPSHTIGGAALLIALSGVASRILGFFRDRILASQFGAGDVLDAYYAAFRIPDFLYSLLVAGALSAAFVPVFTELLAGKKNEEAWRLASGVLILLMWTLGLLGLLGILFAPSLMHLLAPGFGPEKASLTVTFSRIMLLSPLFLGMSAVFGGVLVSFKRFAAYSLAPIFYNLGIIFGAWFLAPSFGPIGLAWGVVLGAFLHMLIQYPALKSAGFRATLASLRIWKDASVRRVITLMIPRSLSMGVSQISLLAMTAFASTLASGSLAAFIFANNIQSVPLGLFGIAFSLAVFPSLSLFAAEKKGKDFFVVLSETARRILFFVVPLSLALIIFRAQFVRVILGTGNFDWEDTILTFEILKFLSFSLFAQSLIPLFARAFFALQNTRTPLYVALASEALHIMLIPLLLPYFQVEALALSFSVASVVNVALLYVFLRRHASFWHDRAFLLPVAKIIFASLLAGAVAQLSKSVFALTTNELDTFIEVFLQLFIGVTIGGTAYLLFAYWLRIDELRLVKRFVVYKIFRQPETATLAGDHPERGEW